VGIGDLPCPDFVKDAIDYVTGYDGCVDNPRGCADFVIKEQTGGVVGVPPLSVEAIQKDDFAPDYVTFQLTGTIISGAITMDTYSNVYVSAGLNGGADSGAASARLSAGYIVGNRYARGYGPTSNQMLGLRLDVLPTEEELEGFSRGVSVSGSAGSVVGVDVTTSLTNKTQGNLVGIEPGIYTPQGGVGVSVGGFLFDARDDGGKWFFELWFE
jgi:hypothetical protein